VTAPHVSEDEFLTAVLDLAQLRRWHVLHLRPARTARGWETPIQAGGKGWPDVFATRGARAIALELKSAHGQTTPEQDRWISDLDQAGIQALVVRPADWPLIVRLLS
jgi:hypothetical protein